MVNWLTPFSLHLSGLQNHLVDARSVSSELVCSHPHQKRDSIKCRKVQTMIAICTKELELLLHHGSLRQTGLVKAQPQFPSGHIPWTCLFRWRDWLLSLGWKSLTESFPLGWDGSGENHAVRQVTAQIWLRSLLTPLAVFVPCCFLCPLPALAAYSRV